MYGMKKHIFIFLLFIACFFQLQAQSVSYTYRPFTEEGCSVSFTPVFVDNVGYIVVSVQSDRLVFSDNPTMKLRFFNTDQILQLEGKTLSATASSSGVLIGNVIVPITETKAMAQFKVTDAQMEMFKMGVEKIRLSTFPIVHERTFQNDKIGMSLFQKYQIAKQKAREF